MVSMPTGRTSGRSACSPWFTIHEIFSQVVSSSPNDPSTMVFPVSRLATVQTISWFWTT
jgi:hypothetical protein